MVEGVGESEGEPLGIFQEQEQEGCCASCNGNAPKGLHSPGETLLIRVSRTKLGTLLRCDPGFCVRKTHFLSM